MLEQESKVKEAEILNCIKSLVKAICSWSDNFVDFFNLMEFLYD